MTDERDELRSEGSLAADALVRHSVSWDGRKLTLTSGTGVTFLYAPFRRVERTESLDVASRRFHVDTDDGQKAVVVVAEADRDSLEAVEAASRGRSRPAPRVALSSPHLVRAARWAAVVEVLAWVYLAAGLLGALAVAGRQGPHSPYVWQGIAVALSTLLVSLAVVMAASYIRGRTE